MGLNGVALTNIFNFRDLGGHRTRDGRVIRSHRLFRSDDLSRLSEHDRESFAALGIRTVVDLRRPNEVVADGRIPQFDGFAYHHVHLVHPIWPRRQFTDTDERATFVAERYREISVEAADGIAATLRLIADPDATPLVFHCIAGKDRTGVISALTLALLGVSDDDIADDYQLSELAEPAAWAYLTRDLPELKASRWQHIIVSPREGMLRFLSELRTDHGSVDGYAARVGVTADHIAAMRAHLLTQPP